MPKSSGLGMAMYVGGFDLSGDVGSIESISCPMQTLPTTGIDKSAQERIGGLRDGLVNFMAYFNPTAGQAHPVLSALPTVDVVGSVLTSTGLNAPAACMVAKQVNYDGTRADSGALTFKTSLVANAFGLEWGVNGTAGKRTESAATNGTSIDLGTVVAAAGFGLQAYLQVFALGSGSPTVKLQGSSDNAVGDPFADIAGGTFGVQAGVGASRIATAANLTIERYLRVSTTGTFAGFTFAVVVVPNVVSTVF